jgi:hypothetical protein
MKRSMPSLILLDFPASSFWVGCWPAQLLSACAAPHAAHAGAEIDSQFGIGSVGLQCVASGWPGSGFEVGNDGVGDEAGAGRVEVSVATLGLVMGIEALGDDQEQLVLGPRHGDVE